MNTERSPLRREEKRQNESFGTGQFRNRSIRSHCGGRYTVAEYTVNYKKTHSQTLLPMLDEIVKMTELDLKTIDAIAVAKGPGSFTGLRIGSATAKGLGLALDKPLVRDSNCGGTGL